MFGVDLFKCIVSVIHLFIKKYQHGLYDAVHATMSRSKKSDLCCSQKHNIPKSPVTIWTDEMRRGITLP